VVHGVGAFADADRQDGFDACVVGASEYLVEVGVVEVEVGVGVDERHVVLRDL
jgi:hypothetical protein